MSAPAGNIPISMNPKAVYDEKDYGFKYGPKWLSAGDTISASTWEIRDAATDAVSTDLEIISSTVIDSNKTSQIWLKAGVKGKTYKVTNKVTTAGGRKMELSFLLPVV